MSVPITYRQKMDFSSCVYMVGFPKYSHKCIMIKLAEMQSYRLYDLMYYLVMMECYVFVL